MKKTIYDYTDYKRYLEDVIHSKPNEGRGFKAKIATATGCQTAYVSQVFNGDAHFSLEQADLIARLLGHRRDESSFFFLLIQYARAGTASLREHLLDQIQEHRKRVLSPKKKRSQDEPLSPEDQLVYYSGWEYNAIHVLLSLDRFRTPDRLAAHLGMPLQKISGLLDFLVSSGLAVRDGGGYSVGTRTIHLDRESPMIPRQHSNWRFRAIQAIDRSHYENLHYTSIMAISREDVEKLKAMIREFIASTKPLIRASKEEAAQALLIDLFPV